MQCGKHMTHIGINLANWWSMHMCHLLFHLPLKIHRKKFLCTSFPHPKRFDVNESIFDEHSLNDMAHNLCARIANRVGQWIQSETTQCLPYINNKKVHKHTRTTSVHGTHWNRTPLLVSVDCTHLLSIKSQRFFFRSRTQYWSCTSGRQWTKKKTNHQKYEGLVRICDAWRIRVFVISNISKQTRKHLPTKIHEMNDEAKGEKKQRPTWIEWNKRTEQHKLFLPRACSFGRISRHGNNLKHISLTAQGGKQNQR